MDDLIIHITQPIRIFYTYIRSYGDKLIKTYKSDGSKVAGANLIKGYYWLSNVNGLDSLDLLFQRMTQYDIITLGVTSNLGGGVVTTGVLDKHGYQAPTISRSNRFIFYLNDIYNFLECEYSLYFFDIDFDKDAPADFQMDTHKQARDILISVNPVFEKLDMLVRDSSSSGVKNIETGEHRNPNRSLHIYIIVAGATRENVTNFTNHIKRRCWELGFAYAAINGVGIVEKYIFDFKVSDPERMIFEATPTTEHPYTHEYTPSSIFKGGVLNLEVFEKEDESIYKEYFQTQKQKLIEQNPSYKKTSNKALKSSSNTSYLDVIKPNNGDDTKIYISDSTVKQIDAIYTYFKANKKPKVKVVIEHFSSDVVKAILTFLGFNIDYSGKFKMRNERTASASIRLSDGFIKDFGGEFSGNIVNFIMYLYQLEFLTAWKYIQNLFGRIHKIKNKTKALPDPKEFEKCLYIKNNKDILW